MDRIIILFICIFIFDVKDVKLEIKMVSPRLKTIETSIGCNCGIFLSGSFKKGSKEAPNENVTLIHETAKKFPCSSVGDKLCIKKCLNTVLKNMHNSAELICDALDRDCYKEKAYLFIQNCKDKWFNTNLSGPRRYCCKDGLPSKCSKY